MNLEVAVIGQVSTQADSYLIQHHTERCDQEVLRFGVLLRAPAG